MADPTFIDTPSGDQLVVLLRGDYDDLLARLAALEEGEDAADAAIAGRRMSEWVAAGRPAYPLPVVRLMRGGDSPLRAFRKVRGMTQQALAAAAKIGQGHLSDLETGRKPLPADLLGELARALDTTPASLATSPAEPV